MPSKSYVFDECRTLNISFDAPTRVSLWAWPKECGAQSCESVHSQLSLETILDRGDRSKEVLGNCTGTGRRTLVEKAVNLRPEGQDWSPGLWEVVAGEMAAFEPLPPNLNLRPP
jgi:hypothetical protein